MKKIRKYLSYRLLLLGGLFSAALLILFGLDLVQSFRAGQVSVAAVAGIVLLAAFWLIFFGTVWIPYKKEDHMIRLFLDGYTRSCLDPSLQTGITPVTRDLMVRFDEDLNSSKLLKLNKRQAQYLALQNQINPHFLYNTLECIRSEALVAGVDVVADMTEALSRFFRYAISKVENLVSVEEELNNCENYFRIQQYRFGSRLELAIHCDPGDREECYRCRLPKLTLQPILENSIIHGTEAKIGTGHLCITLERTQARLLIRISDDGVGMNEETLAKLNRRLGKSMREVSESAQNSTGGLALVNVDNRIQLLFGEEYGLHVYSVEGVGTDVEIVLPLITSDRDIPNREALA